LIRKAIAITQAVDQQVSDLGQWLLEELRELIQTLSDGDGDNNHDPVTGRLYRVCRLASTAEHAKLKALALIDFKGLGFGDCVCRLSRIATDQ